MTDEEKRIMGLVYMGDSSAISAEMAELRRERDDALAKAAEAVRLREEDGAQLLAVESDLRKMTARADNLGIEMQGQKARAEKAEAECKRLRGECIEMANLAGLRGRELDALRGERGEVK